MKFSQYNYLANCSDQLILINVRHSSYVKIAKADQIEHFMDLYNSKLTLDANDDMVKALYSRKFIVDDSINEYEEMKQSINEQLQKDAKKLFLLLYVTQQCNFRCVYCPETHENKIFGTTKWNALYEYIRKSLTAGKYDRIEISFFGGEPLLETDKIINFLEKLNNLSKEYPDIKFYHSITTNGYLLSPEIYDKLVELRLKFYQITVDGFAETHNKTRYLAGGQGTWDKIIENLKYINTKNDDAKILCRTNYNANNIDSLNDWKEWTKKTFTNNKFIFNFVPVSGFSSNVPEELVWSSNNEKTIENYIGDMNIDKEKLRPLSAMCKSAALSRFTINTDGMISKCDNISEIVDGIFAGYLSNEGDFVFYDNYNEWLDGFEIEDCKECPAYPLCAARVCPAKKVLYPDSRPDCQGVKKCFKKWMLNFANKVSQ